MSKVSTRRASRAALIMSAILLPANAAVAQYGAPAPSAAERPEDALARNLRLIAQNPRDFQALNAAGHAALETGDTQAAAGFFGRAAELSPRSWQPQAGMAAAMVAMGDPRGALTYFTRAQEFGAAQILIALDRGLAFDLLGDQARAQSDYRVAMQGAETDEARRRLALSLAISRDTRGAAATIDPLLRRNDLLAVRINAFILALAGDQNGARRAIDAAMPGAGARFEPFFKVLPVLRAEEKAAAVHLGIFPNDAAQRYAYAQPIPTSPTVTLRGSQKRIVAATPTPSAPRSEPPTKSTSKSPSAKPERIREPSYSSMDPARLRPTQVSPAPRQPKTKKAEPAAKAEKADPDPEPRPAGRLDDIAAILTEQAGAEEPAEPLVQVGEAQPPEPQPGFSMPPAPRPKVETIKAKSDPNKAKAAAEEKKKADKLAAEKKAKAEAEKKAKAEAARLGVTGTNWVQIAGGSNEDRMASEYKKLAAKAGSVLKARAGYVTQGKDYFRLLVGPFDSPDEAQAFVTKLDKAGVDSFRWTRNPAQIRIEKLKS